MPVSVADSEHRASREPAADAGVQALWWTAPGEAALRPLSPRTADLATEDATAPLDLTTLFSGLSHGTERLVALGHVPEALWQTMACPHQRGAFGFPVCYGYSLVGVDQHRNRWHALHPHSTEATVDRTWLTAVPDDVPSDRATLLPNIETALNAVWAGSIQAGDRCAVVGAGVVGQAIAKIARSVTGVDVCVVEPILRKRDVAQRLGNDAIDPHDTSALAALHASFDAVFHTSATEAGLRTALALGADDAAVIEVSWFGDQAPAVPLGLAFHTRRLRLISAQVGEVPPHRRARWNTRRRREHAMALLRDPSWHALLDETVPFVESPAWLHANIAASDKLHTVFAYPGADKTKQPPR